MSQPLTIKIRPFGPNADKLAAAAAGAFGHPAVRRLLRGVDHRVLAVRAIPPEGKQARPRQPDRVQATVYDYKGHRTLEVRARLDGKGAPEVAETAHHPHVSPEEFAVAVEVVRRSRELGPALRQEQIRVYRPMPPVVAVELPDGRRERHVTVGLLPAGRRPRHEIVAVDLGRRRVTRFRGGAPATALATATTCGVPADAGQPTAAEGTPGQAQVTVSRGNTLLWELLAVRPAASFGFWGSGIELRHVAYRGKSVLYQAHVPVLNVRYDADLCGPYRDWQWQEGMLQAQGADAAPGFRLCQSPAKTILESGSDTGNYLGVGVYAEGDEVVLVSELEAGWYRYVSRWRLHANGEIRPRFGFAAVDSSCVCNVHHHHVYWRLDFDVGGPRNTVRERAGASWTTLPYEVKRLRDVNRRWRVVDAAGKGYEIVPGANDGTAAGDPYAKGDLWALRYRSSQLDDHPISGTEAELDKFVNHEPIVGEDVVVWYAAHFKHDVAHHGPHDPGHIVGPTLVPC